MMFPQGDCRISWRSNNKIAYIATEIHISAFVRNISYFWMFNFLCWSSQYLFYFFYCYCSVTYISSKCFECDGLPEGWSRHPNFLRTTSSKRIKKKKKKAEIGKKNKTNKWIFFTHTFIITVNYEVHVLASEKMFAQLFTIKLCVHMIKRISSQWISWPKLFSIISIERWKRRTLKGKVYWNYFSCEKCGHFLRLILKLHKIS